MPKHYYTPEEAAALPPWVRELTLKDEGGYYVEIPEQTGGTTPLETVDMGKESEQPTQEN